ncbi:hypothetical protein [Nocardioides speluncae]|nr:hypothetical protein [Nocardioides speluncae]
MSTVSLYTALSLTDEPTRAHRDAAQLNEVRAARREQRTHAGVLSRLLDR